MKGLGRATLEPTDSERPVSSVLTRVKGIPFWRHHDGLATSPTALVNEVESRTGAVTVVSRWLLDVAFASLPQSGLAWFCFLFPLIEPDRRSYRIRLSEKTHDVTCDATCNF